MSVSTRKLPRISTEDARASSAVSASARLLGWLLVAAALSVRLGSLGGWSRIFFDDIRYGRPRTDRLTATIGRIEEQAGPSHLIAMNLDRQVVILEIPGGDPSRLRTIPGPYLVGAGEDLTPVTMYLQDENADALPDLIVRIKNEELVYLNLGDGFRPMSAAERKAAASVPAP